MQKISIDLVFCFILQEICNRPVFVSDSTSQFDISPGKMGKCGLFSTDNLSNKK